MVFIKNGLEVEVNFVSMNLGMMDTQGVWRYWTMDVGLIDPKYQSLEYFNFFEENMFGLAPYLTTDENLLNRQFLYKFI